MAISLRKKRLANTLIYRWNSQHRLFCGTLLLPAMPTHLEHSATHLVAHHHSYCSRLGPLLLTWFNFNPAWISNHMSSKLLDEITYPFPNFNGATVEVWERIINFLPHLIILDLMDYNGLIYARIKVKPYLVIGASGVSFSTRQTLLETEFVKSLVLSLSILRHCRRDFPDLWLQYLFIY